MTLQCRSGVKPTGGVIVCQKNSCVKVDNVLSLCKFTAIPLHPFCFAKNMICPNRKSKEYTFSDLGYQDRYDIIKTRYPNGMTCSRSVLQIISSQSTQSTLSITLSTLSITLVSIINNIMPMRPRWWENPTPEELAWFNSLSPRSKSEIFHWTLNERSHPGIHAGLDQCFRCGELGHSRITTGCISTNPFPHQPDFNDWRRASNGKMYTVAMLRMTDEALAAEAALALLLPLKLLLPLNSKKDYTAIEAPITLSSEELDLLDSIEAAASMASQAVTVATEATEHGSIVSREGSTTIHEGPQDGQDLSRSFTVDGPSAEASQESSVAGNSIAGNGWAQVVQDVSRHVCRQPKAHFNLIHQYFPKATEFRVNIVCMLFLDILPAWLKNLTTDKGRESGDSYRFYLFTGYFTLSLRNRRIRPPMQTRSRKSSPKGDHSQKPSPSIKSEPVSPKPEASLSTSRKRPSTSHQTGIDVPKANRPRLSSPSSKMQAQLDHLQTKVDDLIDDVEECIDQAEEFELARSVLESKLAEDKESPSNISARKITREVRKELGPHIDRVNEELTTLKVDQAKMLDLERQVKELQEQVQRLDSRFTHEHSPPELSTKQMDELRKYIEAKLMPSMKDTNPTPKQPTTRYMDDADATEIKAALIKLQHTFDDMLEHTLRSEGGQQVVEE
ncbi:uncharacterized protein MELLADRAFT_103461 [Melampsora larici-populina 98AG31]|uniref:CCHC-type domain-containing protein n=1 Tax=Melampsora larici-populina (strain 98AG31 / pathotype 3-4-7) TaxID=747676 RepID=F4RBI8_MELLP|nr:uncharacterized protein MELLADRAFT_103461 [Melampsora larici-populina 98AG31]EGG10353.1 hypothetical protein MELLADRAFT_103461 [Melampsora larici-populina 98AG31]